MMIADRLLKLLGVLGLEPCPVDFDHAIRRGKLRGVDADAYLHRSLKPLDEIDFGTDTTDQLEIDFGNECEGMCGV